MESPSEGTGSIQAITIFTLGTHGRIPVSQVPNVARDLKTAWSISRLGDVPADALGEDIILEVANRLAGETGADEEEDGGRTDEEPVKSRRRSGTVDRVAYGGVSVKTVDCQLSLPTIPPAIRPTMTGMGMEAAGRLSDTYRKMMSYKIWSMPS